MACGQKIEVDGVLIECGACPACVKTRQNRERQRRLNAKRRDEGLSSFSVWVSDEERFYLERVLKQMRETGGRPAMFRRKNGTLCHFDA